MARAKRRLFHETSDKVVELAARIRLVQWSKDQSKHLKHLHRGTGLGECEDVLAQSQRMILREPLDVFRIVEHPLALHLYMTRIVLPKALKTWTANRCCVRPPVSRHQFIESVCARPNTAIDDWNQVTDCRLLG